MVVKMFKKTLLVSIVVVLLLASTAVAAPAPAKDSTLFGGKPEASEYTKTIPGGIEVTYKGVWKHGEIFEVYYTVVSARDGRVSIEADNSPLIDANDVNILPVLGNKNYDTYRIYSENFEIYDRDWNKNRQRVEAGAYINDKKKDNEEFVADQPYKVAVRYWVPGNYVLTPTFKSVTVVINGLPVEFKDVSIAP